jgi:hypothetical protein
VTRHRTVRRGGSGGRRGPGPRWTGRRGLGRAGYAPRPPCTARRWSRPFRPGWPPGCWWRSGLVLSHLIVSTVRPDNAGAQRSGSTRACWPGTGDGINRSPPTAMPPPSLQSVRFFPAFPMAARVLGWIPGVGVGDRVGGDLQCMRAWPPWPRSSCSSDHDLGDGAWPGGRCGCWPWLPPPTRWSWDTPTAALLLCSIVTVLAARTQRWWWAAAAGRGGRPGSAGGDLVGGARAHRGLA